MLKRLSEPEDWDRPSADAQPEAKWFKRNGMISGLICSDALLALRQLNSGIFNVAVTSPPYYWARDYGYDGQLGHEETVEESVNNLADVFDEVKRVLHPEGVFFLNIGDTYYSGNGQPHGTDPRSGSRAFMRRKLRPVDRSGWEIPKKSLIGVPWKVAFEMQRRGWTLRSEIVWNRGNAFVEPTARDRPYRQHEHIFLFSKTRFYSFDRSSLAEEDVWNIPIDRRVRIEHNAAFPAELVKRCIEAGSPVGGKVLDPFNGSGTTVDVAARLGRHAVGVDMSQEYFQKLTSYMQRNDAMPISETEAWEQLKEPSPHWKAWAGNKDNYRKPRSRRV
jgi:site-specific DNA-methyltransferase (adenine-specific)